MPLQRRSSNALRRAAVEHWQCERKVQTDVSADGVLDFRDEPRLPSPRLCAQNVYRLHWPEQPEFLRPRRALLPEQRHFVSCIHFYSLADSMQRAVRTSPSLRSRRTNDGGRHDRKSNDRFREIPAEMTKGARPFQGAPFGPGQLRTRDITIAAGSHRLRVVSDR